MSQDGNLDDGRSVPSPGSRGAAAWEEAAVTWGLLPFYSARSQIRFRPLLRKAVDADLRGPDMRALLTDLIGDKPMLAGFIDAEAPHSGAPLARSALIFELPSHWILTLYGPRKGKLEPLRAWKIPEESLDIRAWQQALSFARLADPPDCSRVAEEPWPGGALVRREHASIEVVSARGTRVVFDPIFRSTMLDCAVTMPPPWPGLTAAFLTHSHYDHFNLATLEYLSAAGAKVYVPSVPRRNLLAEDMFGTLTMCGIPAACCEWGSVTDIDDIQVEALPFLGEQPSALVAPPEAAARNWGNCYRVDTADFSALLLSDTGADPRGNMLGAIAESVRRDGPVDVVVGSLRYFYSPFEVEGLATGYSVLPFDGLRSDLELYRNRRLASTTLGVSGAALACAEAGAAFFLPYAHGLTGYRQPIAASAFGPAPGLDEAAACRVLADELERIGCDTSVVSWNPGDHWTPRRGR
jgi:L-ascorbate metabolism protein UlaG (beta-lactamase superfamily)